MKVFITGISGFVGSRLVEAWAGTHDLAGCSRNAPEQLRAEHFPVDLTVDPRNVTEGLDAFQPDWVIHAAAVSQPQLFARDPQRCRRVNVESGHWVADWCRRRERGLIAFSSDTVYPDAASHPAPAGGWAESAPLDPISQYAHSKVEMEIAVAQAYPPALLLRSSLLYGRSRPGGNSFTGWLESRLQGQDPVPVFTDNLRHALAVAQLIGIVTHFMALPAWGVLNLGGSDYLSREELARRYFAQVGAEVSRLCPLRQAEADLKDPIARELPLNLSRLTALLGRAPGSCAEGMALEFPQPGGAGTD